MTFFSLFKLGLAYALAVPFAAWASEAPINSVAGMSDTMSSVGAAANVKINPQTCSSVNKVLPFGRTIMSYANCFGLPDACPWALEQALDQDFFPV